MLINYEIDSDVPLGFGRDFDRPVLLAMLQSNFAKSRQLSTSCYNGMVCLLSQSLHNRFSFLPQTFLTYHRQKSEIMSDSGTLSRAAAHGFLVFFSHTVELACSQVPGASEGLAPQSTSAVVSVLNFQGSKRAVRSNFSHWLTVSLKVPSRCTI